MSVVSCAVGIMKPALNLPDGVSVPPTLLILRSRVAHPTQTEVHSTFLQVKLAVFTLGQHHTSREKTAALAEQE